MATVKGSSHPSEKWKLCQTFQLFLSPFLVLFYVQRKGINFGSKRSVEGKIVAPEVTVWVNGLHGGFSKGERLGSKVHNRVAIIGDPCVSMVRDSKFLMSHHNPCTHSRCHRRTQIDLECSPSAPSRAWARKIIQSFRHPQYPHLHDHQKS